LNNPSRKFRDRVGNILVLPHGKRTIWFKGDRGYDLELSGHHGGLTKDEMTVPLAVGRLSDLQR
jgi:predicted MPP superfamily phosphohydrolase